LRWLNAFMQDEECGFPWCPVCGGQKKSQKNVTCSRACANTFFRRGEGNGQYRKGVDNYRTICFQYHEKKCVVCGEDKIVAVHHWDENHDNHDPTNLVPMCPTHHGYMHSKFKHLVEETVNSYHERMFESLPLLERHSEADEYEDRELCEEELCEVAEEHLY
jgi:hypothetical protein